MNATTNFFEGRHGVGYCGEKGRKQWLGCHWMPVSWVEGEMRSLGGMPVEQQGCVY